MWVFLCGVLGGVVVQCFSSVAFGGGGGGGRGPAALAFRCIGIGSATSPDEAELGCETAVPAVSVCVATVVQRIDVCAVASIFCVHTCTAASAVLLLNGPLLLGLPGTMHTQAQRPTQT